MNLTKSSLISFLLAVFVIHFSCSRKKNNKQPNILLLFDDAADVKEPEELSLDGVSLIPHLKDKNAPHKELFWRKDKMAAARVGNNKLIRVENLPSIMYNLSEDLGELHDLSSKKPDVFEEVNTKLESWEEGLIAPLWTEGAVWDSVTWMIHEDLMTNQKIRVKNPNQLRKFYLNNEKSGITN